MENDNVGPAKDQVIETVIDIFVRVIGFIERKDVSSATNPAKDFNIDTDDLSLFIAEIEKHFHISASQSEWFNIDGTIESVAGLVLRHC
jgi:acyl carrier protein